AEPHVPAPHAAALCVVLVRSAWHAPQAGCATVVHATVRPRGSGGKLHGSGHGIHWTLLRTHPRQRDETPHAREAVAVAWCSVHGGGSAAALHSARHPDQQESLVHRQSRTHHTCTRMYMYVLYG